MTGNLLAWVAQATLLAAVAAILPALLRLHAPRPRLIFWQSALALVVLLPILQPWHTAAASASATVTATASSLGASPSTVLTISGVWLPVVLVAGVLFRLLWLGLGLATLAGYRAHARPFVPPVASSALMARLGVVPFLAESDRVSVPVTFGWRRPTILVPRGLSALSDEVRAAALGHELIHVVRRDWLMVLAEELVRAVAWFHPGVWLLLGRIALAREQVVDQLAITLTGDRRTYLETLYQLAHTQRATALAVPFVSRGHLLARIRLLTQEITMTRSRALLSVAALALVTALTTLLSTATFPLMAVARAADGPVYVVEGDVQPPKRVSGDAPVYPEDARKDRVVGKVVLKTVIDRTGMVDEIQVIESVDDRLSTAASDAVRAWRFSPATKDGEPVNVHFTLTINFRLER